MPQIDINSYDLQKINEIVGLIRKFIGDLTVEGRFVLALELVRLVKPELDELKRRQGS